MTELLIDNEKSEEKVNEWITRTRDDVKELAERRKYFKGNLAIGYVLIVGANFIKLGIVKNKDARSVRKGTTQVYMVIHILYE